MEVKLNKSQFVSMMCKDLGLAKPTKRRLRKMKQIYISTQDKATMDEEMQCTRKDDQALEVNRCLATGIALHPKENILDLILSRDVDIDNGEIYDIKTGETIRRIEEWMDM